MVKKEREREIEYESDKRLTTKKHYFPNLGNRVN